MKNNLDEKNTKEKMIYAAMRMLRIAFWVCVAYFAFLSFKAGKYISKPLVVGLLIVPAGIYNIIQIRKSFQGSDKERKKFNKIVIRSVILGLIIMVVFVTVVVLVKLKMG